MIIQIHHLLNERFLNTLYIFIFWNGAEDIFQNFCMVHTKFIKSFPIFFTGSAATGKMERWKKPILPNSWLNLTEVHAVDIRQLLSW